MREYNHTIILFESTDPATHRNDASYALVSQRDVRVGIAIGNNAHTGTLLSTFSGHTGAIRDCTITPAGDRIVSASADRTVRIWNANDQGEPPMILEHDGEVLCCAVSPTEPILVSLAGTQLKLWSLDSGTCLTTFYSHNAFLDCAFHRMDTASLLRQRMDCISCALRYKASTVCHVIGESIYCDKRTACLDKRKQVIYFVVRKALWHGGKVGTHKVFDI